MANNDITQFEILCLPEKFNLTDGHAHRSLNASERVIIDNLSDVFYATDREQQLQLEKDYISVFYDLFSQTIDKRVGYLLLPSASLSLEITANFLRLQRYDLALIEPCVDNVANIFKRHGVNLEPIPDHYLSSNKLVPYLKTLKSEAICIVSPNNPTGMSYSKTRFEEMVRFCKKYNKLLILDSSFRAYRPVGEMFDEYKLLSQSGIDYICIEDSGKAWPTKGLKVSILASSPNVRKSIYDIYTDFIYHHSPISIRLVTEFLRNSNEDKLQSVQCVVDRNRQVLYDALEGTFLDLVGQPFASVAWLKINNPISAVKLQTLLAEEGVFILTGNQFFWSQASKGRKFVRVALARDEQVFKAAVQKLRKVVLATT